MSTPEPTQTHSARSSVERSFPVFPPELEREIFLLTAQTHQGTSVGLMLVASRVKNWIEPFVYRTVILRGHAHAIQFFSALVNNRSPEFTKTHVKALCIRPSIPLTLTIRLLDMCSGLESLALWILPQTGTEELTDLISSLPITFLSLNIRSILPESHPECALQNHPAFLKLTHLDIVNHWVLWAASLGIECLPHLTHVAFRFLMHGSVSMTLSMILRHSPKLQVLVLLADASVIASSREYLEREGIRDVRVVMLKHTRDADEWELMERDAANMWQRADVIVAWRRRNQAGPFDFPPEISSGPSEVPFQFTL